MTTKIKGTEGIEFPDATVQATAATGGEGIRGFFQAKTAADQSGFASGVLGKVSLTEVFDQEGWVTSPSGLRYTPQIAGYYQFSADSR